MPITRAANETARQKLATPEEFSVQAYFQAFGRIIPQLPYAEIQQIISVILWAYKERRTVFIFGNGGSAATASHLACDLTKGVITRFGERRFKAMAFTDNVPSLTAWANDAGFEHIFSEPLKNFVRPWDVALAISASGNSTNVIEALKTAREAGAVTTSMAGCGGGKMQEFCDVCAVVPCDNIQIVEDLHQAIAHSIFTAVRAEVRGHSQAKAAAAVVAGAK